MPHQNILWKPTDKFLEEANLTAYSNWLARKKSLHFKDYKSLWQWSVDHIDEFWKSIAEYFEVRFHTEPTTILSSEEMPGTKWFEGATLNYAEHIFKQKTAQFPALHFASERQQPIAVSWETLERETAAIQQFLKRSGVKKGDRVAAYLPNIPQAISSFLATNATGAVWSSCSPDFGAGSVLDRFQQIEPKVLIAVDGYTYNGKPYNRLDVVREIREQLPTVEKVLVIPYLNAEETFDEVEGAVLWDRVMEAGDTELTFTPVDFSDPIWVLYSSGTTGAPKAITHSNGGMLLEHYKYMSLHNDIHKGENFFWFSTTGWMMWNIVQASLLVGATAVLYDGSAGYPDLDMLWRLAEKLPIHHFGTSAPYIIACMKRGLDPMKEHDLSALRSIGSTGSPLPADGFDYVYDHISKKVWLCSMSGGTDICTAWVGGNPWKPVIEGEIQSRSLGCAMYAYDEEGSPMEDQVGEMVVAKPMPCMPVFFWGDSEFKRYKASYFEMYPGKWRHGDWVEITSDGGVIITGRSDTTLNRQGVRIGTAEVYQAVDKIESIKDSLIVNVEQSDGGSYMPLFVIMKPDQKLDEGVRNRIRKQLRKEFSPRHVPDEIIAVKDLPFTISGKKMEAPVKKILMGIPVEKAAQKGAMRNPESLELFVKLASERA